MGKRFSKGFATAVLIAGVFGIAGLAFAHGGWGYGHPRGGRAMNSAWDCPRWSGESDGDSRNGMSPEQSEALAADRQAFYEATRSIRDGIHQKRLELRSEMAKAEPDAAKAAGIQTELSKMQGELAQKRVQHRIEMQKRFPDAGSMTGYGRGQGRGSAPGRYGMQGGAYGPGACWR